MGRENSQPSSTLRWTLIFSAIGVFGTLAFILPLVFDHQLGDGEYADWVEAGYRTWLAVIAIVAPIAATFGYWLPYASTRNTNRSPLDLDGSFNLVTMIWGFLWIAGLIFMLALDGEPRGLLWLTGASWAFVTGTALHLMWPSRVRALRKAAHRKSEERQRQWLESGEWAHIIPPRDENG